MTQKTKMKIISKKNNKIYNNQNQSKKNKYLFKMIINNNNKSLKTLTVILTAKLRLTIQLIINNHKI